MFLLLLVVDLLLLKFEIITEQVAWAIFFIMIGIGVLGNILQEIDIRKSKASVSAHMEELEKKRKHDKEVLDWFNYLKSLNVEQLDNLTLEDATLIYDYAKDKLRLKRQGIRKEDYLADFDGFVYSFLPSYGNIDLASFYKGVVPYYLVYLLRDMGILNEQETDEYIEKVKDIANRKVEEYLSSIK